jgi:hypothetical protein
MCLFAWPSGLDHAPSCFTVHEFDGPGLKPRADTVKQTVHSSGVSKLVVSTSMQWVTVDEDSEGQACGCTMAGMWTMHPVWRKQPHVGVLQSARATLAAA